MDKTYAISEMRFDRNNVLWHLEFARVSNNTTEIPERKKTTSWTPNDQATDKSTHRTIEDSLKRMYTGAQKYF